MFCIILILVRKRLPVVNISSQHYQQPSYYILQLSDSSACTKMIPHVFVRIRNLIESHPVEFYSLGVVSLLKVQISHVHF